MRSLLKRFSKPVDSQKGAKPNPSREADVTARPSRPLYVIGDVHGALPLLHDMLKRVDDHLHSGKSAVDQEPLLVFVGDLVDRGESSAQVLTHVQKMCSEMSDYVMCLMGNHERMMLDFLEDPTGRGPRWLRNGGLQTLASFGVSGIGGTPSGADLIDIANALRAKMPEGQEAWLRALPLSYQSGNVLCVHAAADPTLPPDAQSDRVLMWGQDAFLTQDRLDDIVVIHGHTVVDTPLRHATRIAVDTGAYFTGRLTTGAIDPEGSVTFLQTGT